MPVLLLQEGVEQLAPGAVAVAARRPVPLVAARMRGAQTGDAMTVGDLLCVSRCEPRSDDHQMRTMKQDKPAQDLLGDGDILPILVTLHAAAGPRRRAQKVVTVGDVIERELVRCHPAFLQAACDCIADLPVDRVPAVPASGDVAGGTRPALQTAPSARHLLSITPIITPQHVTSGRTGIKSH